MHLYRNVHYQTSISRKFLKISYDFTCLQPSADLDDLKDVLRRLPLAAQSLDSRGLYIYDDGFRLVLWFGRMLSPDIAKNLLGADFAAELSRVCSSYLRAYAGFLFL